MIHTTAAGSVIDLSVPMVQRAIARLLRERLATLNDEFAAGPASSDDDTVALVDRLSMSVRSDCLAAGDLLDLVDDDAALLAELAEHIETGARITRAYLAPHLAEAARGLRLALQAGLVQPALRTAEALKAAAARATKVLVDSRADAAKWTDALEVAVARNTARQLARCSSPALLERATAAGLRADELQAAYRARYYAQREVA